MISDANRCLHKRSSIAGSCRWKQIFMDYLTYEAQFDLAIMRYGYRRWKAGSFAGTDSAPLADSFFAETGDEPTVEEGISVAEGQPRTVSIRVFGGLVREEIESSEIVGEVGRVRWASTYERLRRTIRGEPARDSYDEELARERGGFRVDYSAEFEEYVELNASTPWASLLYALPADEVADLYAGAAAAGGLEATAASTTDPAARPTRGWLGGQDSGIYFEVIGTKILSNVDGQAPRNRLGWRSDGSASSDETSRSAMA